MNDEALCRTIVTLHFHTVFVPEQRREFACNELYKRINEGLRGERKHWNRSFAQQTVKFLLVAKPVVYIGVQIVTATAPLPPELDQFTAANGQLFLGVAPR